MKSDLLKKLEENRAEHREIFEEAVTGYKEQAIKLLEQHIKRIKNGKMEQVVVSLPVPEDHTIDYDRVIAMLNMHVEDTVQIPEDEFRAYVMDDWNWRRQFLASASSYSPKAENMFRKENF